MKPTKGPWKVTKILDGGNVADIMPIDIRICDKNGPEENMANAHLIAAAPEMLEALEVIEAGMTKQTLDELQTVSALNIIRSAIRKAKGGA